MKKCQLLLAVLFLEILTNSAFASFRDIDYDECLLTKESFDRVINEVKKNNPNAISSLAGCLRANHKLIFQASIIDSSQLANSENIFKDNENFVTRLMKVHPEILQYASSRLRNDKIFIERTTYIDRDALKYADEKLRDNIIFMRKMIKNDSRNYLFASKRIKSSKEHAKLAFEDNGALIMYAPDEIRADKELVKIALKSSLNAFDFIDESLKKDKEILKISKQKQDDFSKKKLEEFIQKKYLTKDEGKNVGKKIDTKNIVFKKNILIDRKYVTKWNRTFKLKGYHLEEKWQLIEAPNRNYPIFWKDDLKAHPQLVKKVEDFFLKRYIDQETVDNLSLTYLWKIKNKPLTFAFNLYMLRQSNDIELGDDYVSITSLTAIAQKVKNDWKLTIVEVIFDSETKIDIAYKNAHKRYFLQDLYVENKKDKNPKIIFRVEDRFNNYFEVFSEMRGDKYHMIYRLDPLEIKNIDYDNEDAFNIKRTREEQEEYEWRQMMKRDGIEIENDTNSN